MQKIFTPILLAIVLSQPNQALSATKESPLPKSVESLIAKYRISSRNLSLYVAEERKVLLALNENHVRVPASVTKLVTAYSALKNFPPGTQFSTELKSIAPKEASALKGDLYLVGGGDPGFVSETLWVLVNHFSRSGIRKIEGDLVIDDFLFTRERFDSSRQDLRVQRAYDAPVGAASFNWNSVNVSIRPGEVGKKAEVILDPVNSYTELQNRTQTTSKSKSDIRIDRKSKPGSDLFIVEGTISESETELIKFASITQPDLWMGHNLKEFLRQRGIDVSGNIRSGKTPDLTTTSWARVQSKPIELIVADMNKFSNNYVAEMLALHLGLLVQSPGTIENGMSRIRQDLLELGLKSTEINLSNPSGFNRENQMTAKGLFILIENIKNDFSLFPEFLSGLPIAGVDGTLKSRMKNQSRMVRAKTGLLSGVNSMAGYMARSNRDPLPFVFIHNGPEDASKVRQFFDDLTKVAVQL
ncbi:MAG: D-alanyl-D-alanine carboxypeptidase/D-alanyl-D-alanine-endopeptidase [Bdellovibrio sp.]